MGRRLLPYLAGATGIAAITVAIGLVRRWEDVPTLTVAYIVLVIYLGARFGRLPALTTALASFVVYEFFFVPPYGSLLVSAPRDLISLVVLLAAAAMSELVVSALVARTSGAEAKAQESRSLYEVALAALRETEPRAALQVLCQRAAEEAGIASMTIVDEHASPLAGVAGAPASERELSSAAWSISHDASQGLRVEPDGLTIFEQIPAEPTFLRVPGGVAIIRTAPPGPTPETSRVLGALAGMAGLLLDRQRANESRALTRELEESNRVKTNVLVALTHEVKTPLASLRTGLSAMALDRRLDDGQRQMLTGLEGQAARLDRIVQDVLTMSRLDEGLTGERALVSIAEVVGSAVGSLEHRLQSFQLIVEVPADLPPVAGDEVQLDRVFANLLENAAHWTRPGGAIRVGARARAGWVESWVENEGPEIPTQALQDVFAPYWTRRPEGSGLGLAISRRIAETHGGTLVARNTRSGPRFTMTLPAAQEGS
jgi:two-component system sensor histidine kinase KdpD